MGTAAGAGVGRLARREAALLLAAASAAAALLARGPLGGLTQPLALVLALAWLVAVILWAALAVAHRAEVLAHLYGEPLGTLILTLSAVGIEVIMITAMMFHGDPDPTMARDTIYSVLIILVNGLIGLAMLVGGVRHGEQHYNLKSSTSFFSMILAFAGIGLYLPNALPGPARAPYEGFLMVVALALYVIFLRIQTREHRHFFTYDGGAQAGAGARHRDFEAAGGGRHGVLLLATLAAIAYLAHALAVVIDRTIDHLGLPEGLAPLMVAVLVLSPEGLTALRAGLRNDMQRVVNIALGSALSTLGLTIPAVVALALLTGRQVILGLTPVQGGLLALTLLIGMNNYRSGETNVLQGAIHFALFATYVALIFL